MPISHVFAEGIGPFKKLHLDLRGQDGKPSLGPHILAGVNGSGKSTILNAIAWCLARPENGFAEEFTSPRILLVFGFTGVSRFAVVRARHLDEGLSWARQTMAEVGLNPSDYPFREKGRPGVASYSSTGLAKAAEDDAIEVWLLSLYIKRAIAKERGESTSRYTAIFSALERGLRRVCGEDVSIFVEIEPSVQPKLRIGQKVLTFSEFCDGLKVTLAWMADFMMRGETLPQDLLLVDGIEGFLHPLWQRRILPAMREALPETQSIVTSHSPFVISSCAESIIHVLKVRKDGSAYAEPPVKAPIGESITSTLKDIFGVDSRFDVETEKQLNEWNDLNKIRADGSLGPKDEARFAELTRVLSSRSEELRSIVHQPAALPKATVDSLTETPQAGRVRRRVATH